MDALWILPDKTSLAPKVIEHMLLFSYRKKVPLIGLSERQAEMGALFSLSFASSEDIGRQAGELVDRLLSAGAKLPIPYTTARQVNLTVNLKAAKKLGVEVPKRLVVGAHTVIK